MFPRGWGPRYCRYQSRFTDLPYVTKTLDENVKSMPAIDVTVLTVSMQSAISIRYV